MRASFWATLCVAVAIPVAAAGQNDPAFYGLGDLPGGSVGSWANAVSTDGTTVVGHAEGSTGTQAVRWTEAGGLQGLGQPSAEVPFSRANGVSANGSVIVGTATTSSGGRAFRWTAGTGYRFLGTFPCTLCDGAATGEGVSGNGQVVVGSGLEVPLFGSPHVNAARWPNGGTSISDLGDLPGGGEAGIAHDATTTGSVIVGETDASAGPSGFWWNGTMRSLPGLPGAAYRTGALAISDDGSTIVGEANSDPSSTSFPEPVRWIGSNYATIQKLGPLAGHPPARGRALDVTPDGSLIVGTVRVNGVDVAFLWDAARGMRSLKQVLEEEYGLDLAGWSLHVATGISGVNAAGEFVVVGHATNPAGHPEGFVAILSPTACNDGIDNDGDGDVDYPEDPECTAPSDRSERADCDDGLDNDGDGAADFPADPQCTSPADLSELFDCSNGIDDDGDGLIDHPADPGCRSPTSQSERPACSDGLDNDGDGAVDFPADPECLAPSDTSEALDCSDGLDNDGDGLVDFPSDPDCTSPSDPAEEPACSDLVDNDGDGTVDYPAAYPRCRSAADTREAPECSDGLDNDGDGAIDYPADPQCPGPLYDVEAPAQVAPGQLLVVDRGATALLAIDPVTGAARVLSVNAQLTAPEGLVVRADGRVVVSDPAGLFEVAPATGRQQRRSSGGFVSGGDLPVAVDPAGNLVVADAAGLHRVTWNPTGVGTTTTVFALPFGGNPGQLHAFLGHSLVLENANTALTTGIGTLGDGVFRVTFSPPGASKVTPGFSTHFWRDLAAETATTLLAVGNHFTLGEGVFRIDEATGVVSALSTGASWIRPESVAVGPGGTIYVADSGTCDGDGACSGGQVVRVHPTTGARTVVRSGIFAGPLQVRVAGTPPGACADGIDSDGDGLVDLADPGCANAADPSERDPAAPCDNGLDDDGDGLVDFPLDPGCQTPTWPLENPACDNDLDDDGDGAIDWDGGPGGGAPDSYCVGAPWRRAERQTCGLGAELVLVLPLIARLRRRRR